MRRTILFLGCDFDLFISVILAGRDIAIAPNVASIASSALSRAVVARRLLQDAPEQIAKS